MTKNEVINTLMTHVKSKCADRLLKAQVNANKSISEDHGISTIL